MLEVIHTSHPRLSTIRKGTRSLYQVSIVNGFQLSGNPDKQIGSLAEWWNRAENWRVQVPSCLSTDCSATTRKPPPSMPTFWKKTIQPYASMFRSFVAHGSTGRYCGFCACVRASLSVAATGNASHRRACAAQTASMTHAQSTWTVAICVSCESATRQSDPG